MLDANLANNLANFITEPNVAYILFLVGIYGLIFELANPGLIAPGVIGGIALLLGSYAMHLLPVSYTGLGLMLLGIAFIVSEVFLPTLGILGIGGVIAFVAGSLMLFSGGPGDIHIAWTVIATVAVVNALFFFWIVKLWLRIRSTKVVSGKEELLNSEGVALSDFKGEGLVYLEGTHWSAWSDVLITKDQRVKVLSIKGLVLTVAPITEGNE